MKKLVGVPWIAEFRDPWKGNAVTDAAMAHRHQLHRSLQSRLERAIAWSADRLVFVSASTTETYRRRYPSTRTRSWSCSERPRRTTTTGSACRWSRRSIRQVPLTDQIAAHTSDVISTGGRLAGMAWPKKRTLDEAEFLDAQRAWRSVASAGTPRASCSCSPSRWSTPPGASSPAEIGIPELATLNRDEILTAFPLSPVHARRPARRRAELGRGPPARSGGNTGKARSTPAPTCSRRSSRPK